MDARFNESSQSENEFEVTEWRGVKIVGDNLDININPRHQTMTNQTKSLHCFQSYAVKDRINLSNYCDIPPSIKPTEDILFSFLPSDIDKTSIISNFAFLWTRILIEYLPEFRKFKDDIPKHIIHQHYDEMSTKSSVVREVI